MIRVVNIKNYTPMKNEILIMVDKRTIVGNPYVLRHIWDDSERMLVLDMYRYDLFEPIMKYGDVKCSKFKNNFSLQEEFRNYVRMIYVTAKKHNVALGCHCYPKSCHAEIIKEFLEKFL